MRVKIKISLRKVVLEVENKEKLREVG